MAQKKILIPLHENDVAPRFDLATEVLKLNLHAFPDDPYTKSLLALKLNQR